MVMDVSEGKEKERKKLTEYGPADHGWMQLRADTLRVWISQHGRVAHGHSVEDNYVNRQVRQRIVPWEPSTIFSVD